MAGKPYYSIVPCCSSSGTQLDYFNFPIGETPTAGFYVFEGIAATTINGITFTPGYCYEIIGVGLNFNSYTEAPSITDFDLVSNCSDPQCYNCEGPPITTKCFILYSCDGEIIFTDTDLTAYAGTFLSLVGKIGCYYVSAVLPGQCEGNNPEKVTPDPDVPCTCDCKCYQVTGDPTSIFYIDCNLVEHTVSGNTKFCSVIPPVVTGGLTGNIYDFGLCVNGECVEQCYQFVNCQTGQVLITSNTPQITEYFVNSSVVTLNGYEGCWTIELSETCDCPVNVTILQVYADCPTCLPVKAYKFTNCNNTTIVQYSTDDYSAYVGKTVELECGDCWSVTEINYQPPATQPIVILHVFPSCTTCNRKYYKLTDCGNYGNIQYTYTDLSSYLGKVIKIENCDGCFLIEETREYINPGVVVVTDNYADCIECGDTKLCKCTTVKNYATTAQTYNYLDCNGELQTVTLSPGERLDKTCMQEFVGVKSCNCIELTINGNIVNAVLQPNKVNDKPVWVYIYNGLSYTIQYDLNEGWQILNSNVPSGIAAELNNPALPCPSGPWTILSKPSLHIGVYLDDTTLLFEGILYYDYVYNYYTGLITYLDSTFQIVLSSTEINPCVFTYSLFYYNNEVDPPVYEPILQWTVQDCECLNGTYIDVTPSILYVVIESACEIETVDCSVGYEMFIPAATDDIKEYGDCASTGTNLCYSYVITVPALPEPQTLYYKDCTGTIVSEVFPISKNSVQRTICGIPGQTPNDIYITGFAGVTFEQTTICSTPTFTCPPVIYPKRPVIPGYTVPACDIEKFEKFTCNASEILYKTVLQKRYGISNCCPDTDMGDKWLVKKELADLQGAMDPNYVCTPVSSCCNNTPTCGCGCNSTPRTCNSQQ